MKPLAFLGSSTAMQLYVDAATRQGLQVAGIIDSDYYGNLDEFAGLPVIGSEKDLEQHIDKYNFFIGTNWSPDPAHSRDQTKRKYLIDLVYENNIKCVSLIDPGCYIGSNVNIGQGSYIGFNSYIEFNNVIGDFCQIHFNVGISHDCTIGSNSVIRQCSGIANTDVGDNVYIGTTTHVFTSKKRIQLKDNSIINQGLWLMRDAAEGEHVKLTPDAIRTYRNLTNVE